MYPLKRKQDHNALQPAQKAPLQDGKILNLNLSLFSSFQLFVPSPQSPEKKCKLCVIYCRNKLAVGFVLLYFLSDVSPSNDFIRPRAWASESVCRYKLLSSGTLKHYLSILEQYHITCSLSHTRTVRINQRPNKEPMWCQWSPAGEQPPTANIHMQTHMSAHVGLKKCEI